MSETALGFDHGTRGEFRTGAVLEQSFAILAANWPKLIMVGVAVELCDLILFPHEYAPKLGTEGTAVFHLESEIRFLLGIIEDATLTYGIFRVACGDVFDIRESARRGFAKFRSLAVASIYSELGILLGLLALVIPGAILLAMWFVAVPACLVEDLDAVESLRRSRVLTKGFRWRLLGLFAVLGFQRFLSRWHSPR